MTDIATLTHAEEIALADCEQRIETGIKGFIETGSALTFVRDNRLYREHYETFEAYLEGRWGISRRHGYQLMESAQAVSSIEHTGLPLPERESQARELAKVPEPDRADVWSETVERTNGKPTAAAVREVSAEQKRLAAEQRDAREHLRQIVELAWSPNWPEGHVEHWARQLGPYDEELADLTKRALNAITVLDQLVEGTGQ